MQIPRLNLFELEDQPWFPATIRDLATDYLHFLETTLRLYQPAIGLLAEVLRNGNTNNIIDLCSGGGGAMPAVQAELAKQNLNPHITLSDLFPNDGAFRHLAVASNGTIRFHDQPVDARNVPPELQGVRTFFNSFHHFQPRDARAILADAVQAHQPIAIFEVADRSLRALIPIFFLMPLIVASTTPFIRPFSWKRLLWTYLVPLVPMTCWWDGMVSQFRAYSHKELLALANAREFKHYDWRAGRVPFGSAPGYMTYLIGYACPDEKH